MAISRAIIVFLALLGALAVRPALAGTDEEARAHFQNGIDLYKQGRFEEASIEFNRAYEIKPSYRILFNMAQAENELGHFAAALNAYVRYLAEGGAEVTAERISDVKNEIKRLNTLVGMIRMKGGRPGDTVLVDKEVKGTLPIEDSIFVDVGKHEVAVEGGGKRVFERVIKIAGGERVELVVTSENEQEAKAPPAATEAVPETTPAAKPEGSAGKKHGPYWLWGWVATGAGAALLVGGAAVGGVALSMGSDLEGSCPDGKCPPPKHDDLRTMNDLGTASTVLFVAGGAVAATGIALLIVDAAGKESEHAVAVSPGGAVWTWRF